MYHSHDDLGDNCICYVRLRCLLFRYLENGQVHRILVDMAETVRDENTKAIISKLIVENFENVPPPPANGCLPEKSINRSNKIDEIRKYGAAGEGPEHKKLKEFIAEHPEKIGLKNIVKVKIEKKFITNNRADLLFFHKDNTYTVVEIETDNPLPGAHQAIMYRALMCAEENCPLDTNKIKAILVAWEKPDKVKVFCEKYGIGFEKVKV